MGIQSLSSKILLSTILSAALLPVCSSTAVAEGSTGPTLRGSLSQLEFDEGFVPAHKLAPQTPPAETKSLEAPAASPAVIKQDKPIAPKAGARLSASNSVPARKTIAKIAKKTSGEARAMLGINPLSEQKLENQIIVPRLRGPFTDRGDSKKIKSVLSWKPRKAAQCGLPQDGTEMCNKSRALKETLYRFSGNHDFFDSQCHESCGGAEEISVPQGLNIPEATDASFRFAAENGSCHYELDKKSDSNNWHVMSPSRVSCICLPKSCFTN